MTKWKIDDFFLDYIVERIDNGDDFQVITGVVMCDSSNVKDYFEDMKQGTPKGRGLYFMLYDLFEEGFQEYLSNKKD